VHFYKTSSKKFLLFSPCIREGAEQHRQHQPVEQRPEHSHPTVDPINRHCIVAWGNAYQQPLLLEMGSRASRRKEQLNT
jgi:hypothetical protein